MIGFWSDWLAIGGDTGGEEKEGGENACLARGGSLCLLQGAGGGTAKESWRQQNGEHQRLIANRIAEDVPE